MTLRRFLSQDDGLKPSAKDLKRALIDATAELKTMPLELSESIALEGDVPKELLALESSSSSMSSSSSSSSSSTSSSDTDDDAANAEGDCDDDAGDDYGDVGDGGDDDADDADDCDDGSHIHVKKKPAKGCDSATADAADVDDDADSPVSSLHSSEVALLIPGPSKKTTKKAAAAKTASKKR